jgi:colicin import membrane protein
VLYKNKQGERVADKTLYDILELSPTASPESIRAAYERLSGKYQELSDQTGDSDVRVQLAAVKQAFFTLANAEKRAQYDKRITLRDASVSSNIEVVEPFWTMPKLMVIALLVIGGGGVYYKHQKDQARIEAEKAVVEAKAKAETEKAKAEAEKERLTLQREREERMTTMQQQREREAALRQYSFDNRVGSMRSYSPQITQDSREAQRRREEAQAASAARQQYSRDRAELCRIERERYGYSSSC